MRREPAEGGGGEEARQASGMHQLWVARKVPWEVAEQFPGDGAELYAAGGMAHAAER